MLLTNGTVQYYVIIAARSCERTIHVRGMSAGVQLTYSAEANLNLLQMADHGCLISRVVGISNDRAIIDSQ